jgi:beta-glucosidase/6-phospho-beta-glucosidase/beta-galactosidase
VIRALGLLLVVAATTAATPAHAQDAFPRGFLWGTASAGFQSEAGGAPGHADRRSDWWAFTHDAGLIRDDVVSGDRVEEGPGFWRVWRGDLDRARDELHNNAIRLGIEWSRIFPHSTRHAHSLRALDGRANRRAVRHYQRLLQGAQRGGLTVMLTLNHFTLPRWIHDPLAVRAAFAGRGADEPVPRGLRRAGWLSRRTVREFRKFAAYAARKFGRQVDLWATLNEPVVTAAQGYVSIPGVTGTKAPGILSYPAAIRVVVNQGLANAAAYDAIHAHDRHARVGFVGNLLDWRPADATSAADAQAARHADQIFNRTFIEEAVNGWYDTDVDGVEDPGETHRARAGKADFIGVNHYSPARAQALPAPVSSAVPLFDFVPHQSYAPGLCPSTCSDFGWEIDPAGLANVIAEAAGYGKPIYVTENGIDDADDDQRPAYLTGYLRALHAAIANGADVRGYFHWSLTDNFEWAEGFKARFGLYAYDPVTLRRTARPSAALYGEIARTNGLP